MPVTPLTQTAIQAAFLEKNPFHRKNSGPSAIAYAAATKASPAAAAAYTDPAVCNPTTHGTAITNSASAIVNQEFGPLLGPADLITPIDFKNMAAADVRTHANNINMMAPVVPGMLGYAACGLDKTWKNIVPNDLINNCVNKGDVWTLICVKYQ